MTAEPDPEDPAFLARLWAFLADGELAPESPDAYHFACYMQGMCTGWMVQFHMLARRLSREQAEAATWELIRSQREIYESLAAPQPSSEAAAAK